MNKGYYCAINILIHNKIYNNEGFPIIYWLSEEDFNKRGGHFLDYIVREKIFENENFKSFIINTMLEKDGYLDGEIKIFVDNGEDNQFTFSNKLNGYYALKDFSSEDASTIYLPYIIDIFSDLYVKSFKSNYEKSFDDELSPNDNIIENIKHIYKLLKDKYKEKLSDTTILQYITKQINMKFSQEDTKLIVENLTNIIVNTHGNMD